MKFRCWRLRSPYPLELVTNMSEVCTMQHPSVLPLDDFPSPRHRQKTAPFEDAISSPDMVFITFNRVHRKALNSTRLMIPVPKPMCLPKNELSSCKTLRQPIFVYIYISLHTNRYLRGLLILYILVWPTSIHIPYQRKTDILEFRAGPSS